MHPTSNTQRRRKAELRALASTPEGYDILKRLYDRTKHGEETDTVEPEMTVVSLVEVVASSELSLHGNLKT
ncbi:hypothetical protein [Singulisphaera sp. PoT]|uniref:hypothetical protein n=1 Tax=Singulisphaera sp. PoT TaxID=3411797 RepID=UPI003BF51BEE